MTTPSCARIALLPVWPAAGLMGATPASSFLSRAFSASSTRRRRASDTCRPPYCAFHLQNVAGPLP